MSYNMLAALNSAPAIREGTPLKLDNGIRVRADKMITSDSPAAIVDALRAADEERGVRFTLPMSTVVGDEGSAEKRPFKVLAPERAGAIVHGFFYGAEPVKGKGKGKDSAAPGANRLDAPAVQPNGSPA